MAGLYLVAAWLIVQVTGMLLPMFDAPAWIPRVVVILLAIGFFPAVIFAWVFEMTPQGLKRDEDVKPEQSIAPQTGRRMDRLIIAVLALALAYFAFDKFILRPRHDSATDGRGIKSIAVLPFVNTGADKGDDYLGDGVSDELVAALARIKGLQVKARTSSFVFKGRNEDIQKIGELLQVSYLLEGSVARAGQKLRITAQLIRAEDGNHLWSDTYDREMQDIFAVRTEVAWQVAETLKIRLLGEEKEQLAKEPTQNLEAHELYLKGRYFWNRRTGADLDKALAYFQQAIAKDSGYALAHAGVADCYSIRPLYSEWPAKEDFARAKAAARRAVELDDSLVETRTALANALGADLQLAAAEEEFKRAFALNPNYASAHQWYGECLQSLGRFEESVAELKKARDLDPLSLIINAILAGALHSAGRIEEAWQQIERTMDLDPDFAVLYWVRGQLFESGGQFDQAIADYERSRLLGQNDAADALIACVYVRSGREARAREILKQLLERSQSSFVSSYPLAQIHAMLGNQDEAVRLLERAYEERAIPVGGGGIGGPKIDHRFDALRDNPRFQKLLARFLGETP